MTATPAPAINRANDDLIAELRTLLGERLVTSAAVREAHGHDESYHASHPPDAVAFARSTEEVQAIVRACAAREVAVIPFGTGTSLEGHVAALHNFMRCRSTTIVRSSNESVPSGRAALASCRSSRFRFPG